MSETGKKSFQDRQYHRTNDTDSTKTLCVGGGGGVWPRFTKSLCGKEDGYHQRRYSLMARFRHRDWKVNLLNDVTARGGTFYGV